MKTILCFGDSNTWGANPFDWTHYPMNIRWPGILRQELGDGYWVIEEGLPGRTTVWDDPIFEHRSGKEYLPPCLLTHQPIDLVILMLGTNDLKVRFNATAEDISFGAGVLVDMIQMSKTGPDGQSPSVLLVAPPPIDEAQNTCEMLAGGVEKSRKFGSYFAKIAQERRCGFFDAGSVITSHPNDGVHLDVIAHKTFGKTLVAKVLELL